MRVIVSYSGGKDSQATLIWAVKKYGAGKVTAAFPYFEPVVREWNILSESYKLDCYRFLNDTLKRLRKEADSIRRTVEK